MKIRKRLVIFLIALTVIFTYSGVSNAQTSQKSTVTDQEMIVRIDTNLVALDVTVTDPKGNYIIDLKADDFEIREDGELRSIDFFQPTQKLQSTSIALVLALDLSGSLSAEETVTQRESIKKFIQQLDKNSLCALIGFNYKIDILQNFTGDHKKLASQLDKIKDYGGSTRIYDALDRAVTMLKKAPTTQKGKRLRPAILVITDGFDSSSIIDKKELINRANASGVTIYSITLPSYSPLLNPNAEKKERLPTLLDVSKIINLTGGRDFSVDNNNYTEVFEEIAKELSSSYTLAYHLPKDRTSQNTHKIEVKVKRSGLQVRSSRNIL
jgi:Ca-activated chloride channel family protein